MAAEQRAAADDTELPPQDQTIRVHFNRADTRALAELCLHEGEDLLAVTLNRQ